MIIVRRGDVQVVAAHGAGDAAAQLSPHAVAARDQVAQHGQCSRRAHHGAFAHPCAARDARAPVDIDRANAAGAVAAAVAKREIGDRGRAGLQQHIERHRPLVLRARAVVEDDALLRPVTDEDESYLHAPAAPAGAGSSPMTAR